MTKSELIAKLCKEKGLPMTKAGDVVNIVFDGIAKTLKIRWQGGASGFRKL